MPSKNQMSSVDAFFNAPSQGKLPVAVPTDTGMATVLASINTAQGTFLARSSSSRARALAAIMATHDAREVTGL